jgi:hypothetical protein
MAFIVDQVQIHTTEDFLPANAVQGDQNEIW